MKKTISFLLALSCFCLSQANNLQIGPVTLTTANGSQYLNFTIGWNNSWRVLDPPRNLDGIWVFVKRKDCASLKWSHVNLAPQDTAHIIDTPLFVDAYTDKKGVMIYRASPGFGNVSNVNVKIKLDVPVAEQYEYKVMGIEMVHIPGGAFFLGDGISTNTFRQGGIGIMNPFLITSESAMTLINNSLNLWAEGAIGIVELSSAYPKGFLSFFCMKYEISQGQYADFLNTITQDAAGNRYNQLHFNQHRYSITGNWPNFVSLTPNRACNWLSFQDLTAYLDWAALSPMSEMEFEKICRGGGQTAVSQEYAWSSNSIIDANLIISSTDGLADERISDTTYMGIGIANFNNDSILGPLRCGFAARANTGRIEAGAGFYGVMEMSGNLTERCYSVFSSAPSDGHLFTGSHGDGELTSTPNAGFSNAGWPREGFNFIGTDSLAVANRGGSWRSISTQLRISDRSEGVRWNYPDGTILGRHSSFGGRGVCRRQ